MIHHRNWPTLIGYTIAIVTFVLMASYGVMYATGYRINLGTGHIEKTGVLAVTTRPSGAIVTISGKKYTKATPLAVRNVLPGEYMVEVALDGYRPFKQAATVKPGFATELSALDLVLEHPDQAIVGALDTPDKIIQATTSGNELWYWTDAKKWFKTEDNKPTEINFDRLPAHVKNILASTSDVRFIKKQPGNNSLVLGLTSAGKKWLGVVDPNSFRGSVFGAPLNQADPENIEMIDNDRLIALVGTTFYTLDLNENKMVVYAKNITSFSLFNGNVYLFSKDASGRPVVQVDNNVFDEKPAETRSWKVPVAGKYSVVAGLDNWWLLQTTAGTSQGLWMIEQTGEGEKATTKQALLSADLRGVTMDYEKKQTAYITGHKLMQYDILTHTEIPLKDFGRDNVTLVGRRNNSLFVQTDKSTAVVDPSGQNYYELVAAKSKLLLSDDSRKFWLLDKNTATEWAVRKNPGLFGLFGRNNISG